MAGRRISASDSGKTTQYTYDLLGRLAAETTPEGTTSFTYDARGNRLTSTAGEVTTTYGYDLNNRMLTSAANGVTTTYTYDDNGNTLSAQEGTAAAKQYSYNAANQLTGYTDPAESITAAYTYQPDGLRKSKTIDGATTDFVWDGQQLALEETGSASTVYIRGLQLIAQTGGTAASDALYYLHDGHGSVTRLTNSAGTITGNYQYDAFGNQENSADDSNPFRYCGEYFDSEMGSYYLRARNYTPALGRFTQEDPIKDGDNWYVYCGNNLVSNVDPMGLEAQLDEYIKANYSGMKTVTLAILRPVANSRDAAVIKNGKLQNGHSFIRLDNGDGDVQYVGFAPEYKSMVSMILGTDISGKFVDDNETEWNVAKVYMLTDERYTAVNDYIRKVQKKEPKYNIETYNCTTFAVQTVMVGGATGSFMRVKKHNWTLPNDMKQQLENYQALPKLCPPGAATWLISNTMGNFYGYTPADAAQDLKSSEGLVLLKYNGSLKTMTNTVYFTGQ